MANPNQAQQEDEGKKKTQPPRIRTRNSIQSDSALLEQGFMRRVKSEVNIFRTKSLNFKS